MGISGTENGERLRFLDALRGLAALAVASFHMYYMSSLQLALRPAIPTAVHRVLRNGGLGVQVFFVLSGFVIAMSIAGKRITRGYVGRFALRRSLRLDPPYWATLAVGSVLLTLAHRPPTLPRLLAHVVYLQAILGYPEIVSAFWTLTYEIQFYLVLVVCVGLAQRYGREAAWGLAVVPFLLSVGLFAAGVDTHGLFIGWWFVFALGAATYGLVSRRVAAGWWIAAMFATALLAVATRSIDAWTALATAGLVALVGRAGRLGSWSGGPVLQYLGRISYSLYLVHFVGSTLAKFGAARHPDALQAAGWFVAATAVSIAVAHVFYLAVERPAQRLSKRVPMSGRLTPVREPVLVAATPE